MFQAYGDTIPFLAAGEPPDVEDEPHLYLGHKSLTKDIQTVYSR